MTTRVANNGAAATTSSSSQVEERRSVFAFPSAQPHARRQAFRDGFEGSGARHDPFQSSVGQSRADLPKMSLAELLRTGGASVPSTGQAEKLVKEAYSEVLMREPDAGGAQLYKDKALEMVRNGASPEEIKAFLKQELANSPEGQIKHPQEFLDKTYQRMLGRSADGEGVTTFGAKMKEMHEAGASFEDIQKSIEQDIMSSPEYQARQTPQTGSTSQTSATSSVGGLAPSDQELAARVNKELEGTGLAGKGETIVAAARKERVPIDLMMSMLQKESSFLSKENNLSIANNNPGNLRWASDGWEAEFGGKPGGPGNFTTFPSVDKGIEAMAHLLGDVYRDEIDSKDYKALVYKYCPPSDQPGGQADTDLYVKQMNEWTQSWQKKLGVDSNWINSAPAGSTAPAASGTGSTPANLKGITPSQIHDAAGFSDQWSLCGPIAAVAASKATGKPVSLEQARSVALQGGNYTPGDGMHGAESEVRLLKDLGIPSHTETPVNWDKVKQQLQSGKPVIISTPKHYFVIEGYNEKTGKFDCGNSALAMKASGGTQTELSPDELFSWGGGTPTAIILD